jgi:hypothetical protein
MKISEMFKTLVDRCPKCKARLYTHFHMMCSDDEQTGAWYVECTKCDWEHDDIFSTLEFLEKVYTIMPKYRLAYYNSDQLHKWVMDAGKLDYKIVDSFRIKPSDPKSHRYVMCIPI